MKISNIFNYSIVAMALFASAAAHKTIKPSSCSRAPYYNKDLGCWSISVEHDATYCIDGPICSGAGLSPTGSRCPVKGDKATADCHADMVSYKGGKKCVLSVNSICQLIHTGAWACVISEDSNLTTTHDYDGSKGGNDSVGSGSSSGSWAQGNGSAAHNETISMAVSGTEAASAGGVSAGVIASIAAAAAAVAAIAGVSIYRQRTTQVRKEKDENTVVEVVTP